MILEGCRMSKVVTFSLGSFTMTEADVTTFLQDSPGICRMSLYDVDTMSDSWEKVFHAIKDTLPLQFFESKALHRGGHRAFRGRG